MQLKMKAPKPLTIVIKLGEHAQIRTKVLSLVWMLMVVRRD